MFHEYALEPSVLSDWQRTRYFLDGFGPWKGRFLAGYPRKWKRMVYEGLKCGEVERLRIVERLRLLDPSVFSPRHPGPYETTRTWRQNVEIEDGRAAFRAVIVGSSPNGRYLDADEVDDDQPLWRVEPGAAIVREPEAFCRALDLLLRASSHVAVIDPFFRADQADKLIPLVALCRRLAEQSVVIHVHASDAGLSYQEFERVAKRAMPRMLPLGTAVTLHYWRARQPGEFGARFHNRYILTDVGGVQFGDSIEQGDPGQHDRLSILGRGERADLWSTFYGSTPAYDPAGQPFIITAVP